MIGPSTLYYLHTEKTDGALENPSAASFIAINLKVPAKVQKAGTDFTIRPHLDLPWEWGGGEYEEALNAAWITTIYHPSTASKLLTNYLLKNPSAVKFVAIKI